jgi:hypothetical protein
MHPDMIAGLAQNQRKEVNKEMISATKIIPSTKIIKNKTSIRMKTRRLKMNPKTMTMTKLRLNLRQMTIQK